MCDRKMEGEEMDNAKLWIIMSECEGQIVEDQFGNIPHMLEVFDAIPTDKKVIIEMDCVTKKDRVVSREELA